MTRKARRRQARRAHLHRLEHGDLLALSLQLGDALKLFIDQLLVVKALDAHDLLHFLN